jgi:hypothetical protein
MDNRELVSVIGTCLDDMLFALERGVGTMGQKDDIKRAIAALEELNKRLAVTLRTG